MNKQCTTLLPWNHVLEFVGSVRKKIRKWEMFVNHICDCQNCKSDSWKLNTCKSLFTSIESFSSLKGWSYCPESFGPWMLSENCRCLVFGLTWLAIAVQLKSHIQALLIPLRVEGQKSVRWSTEDPSAHPDRGLGAAPIYGWLSLPVPSPPLPDHLQLNMQIAARSIMLVHCIGTPGEQKKSSL